MLNAFESLELSRLVVNQNKKNLLENLLDEDKLVCSEELGDLVKTVDNDLALKRYIKQGLLQKLLLLLLSEGSLTRFLFTQRRLYIHRIIFSPANNSEIKSPEACFLTCEENHWYNQPISSQMSSFSKEATTFTIES